MNPKLFLGYSYLYTYREVIAKIHSTWTSCELPDEPLLHLVSFWGFALSDALGASSHHRSESLLAVGIETILGAVLDLRFVFGHCLEILTFIFRICYLGFLILNILAWLLETFSQEYRNLGFVGITICFWAVRLVFYRFLVFDLWIVIVSNLWYFQMANFFRKFNPFLMVKFFNLFNFDRMIIKLVFGYFDLIRDC